MESSMMNQSIIDIKKMLEVEEQNQLDKIVRNSKNNRTFEVSKYCIGKFLSSEIDQQGAGLRGVGRVTDEIPRFGGYYRNELKDLFEDEILELVKRFEEIIYVGYLIHQFRCEESLMSGEYQDKYKLYQMWIMYLLGFDQNAFQQETSLIYQASKETREKIKKQMKKNDFNKSNGSKEDTLENILLYYGIVGFALRRREMGMKF